MSRDLDWKEISLLLYFETCVVDSKGLFEAKHVSSADFILAGKLREEGLIDWGRIPAEVILAKGESNPAWRSTHWVWFSDEAWEITHKARRAKAERIMSDLITQV